MKSIKLIAIAICIIALSSCRDNRTTQERVEDRERLDQTERTDRMDQTQSNQTATTQSSQRDARDREMTRLFGDLNMSQEQINAYEQMEREHRSQSASNQQNQSQSQSDWERRRDQFFRDILTTEQYQRYEQWKRDNPNRNN